LVIGNLLNSLAVHLIILFNSWLDLLVH